MGFQVADTPLTQRYIYELVADVMHTASFFGFSQEDLPGEIEKLKKSFDESKTDVPRETCGSVRGNDKFPTYDRWTLRSSKKYGYIALPPVCLPGKRMCVRRNPRRLE